MFSLGGEMRYWLYARPTDMRKSFHMLSGIVRNEMGSELSTGDVFIFVNKARNHIKLLRKEEAGLVIYAMRLEFGRLRLPEAGADEVERSMEWDDLRRMVSRVTADPQYRMRCLRLGPKQW